MQNNLILSVISILVSFGLASFFTGWIKKVLVRRAILDIPNDRSSHKTPVPRGAGWALLIVLFPSLIGAVYFFARDARHLGLIFAVLLLAIFSGLDDRRHINPAIRLGVHILAAYLGTLAFAPQATIFGGVLPFWLDRAVMILGWAWFMNLYNFMDGIDGITAIETLFIVTGWSLIAAASGIHDDFTNFLTLILTGASLGFLVHNWHPAKIFLGDVGSVPLGFLTGFCLLTLAVKGLVVAAFVLPLYYLADSGITIIKRAVRFEPIWKAHREHFYQKAALGVGSHSAVVVLVIVANIGLIAAAILSVSKPLIGLAAGILIVAILLRKMHRISLPQKASP